MTTSETDNERVRALERRIDAEYFPCFPARTWEEGVLSLAVVHESWIAEALSSPSVHQSMRAFFPDALKYGLMWAFRWGRSHPSAELDGIPASRPSGEVEHVRCADVVGSRDGIVRLSISNVRRTPLW